MDYTSEALHASIDSGGNINISKYDETAKDIFANTDKKNIF
jgi:hypothetical protein